MQRQKIDIARPGLSGHHKMRENGPARKVENDRDFLFNHFNKAKDMLTKTYIIMNHSNQGMPLKQLMNTLEAMIIDSALHVTRGSQKKAARMLGVKQTALCEKMKKLKIKNHKKENMTFFPSEINEY
jgi:DNA-binding NtrC family response regulator